MKRLLSLSLPVLLLCIFPQVLRAQSTAGICAFEGADSLAASAYTRPTGLDNSILTTRFKIHYTQSGVHATTLAYAQSIAAYADSSWLIQCTQLGWREPGSDLSNPNNGGDGRYDIYVVSLGSDTNGATPQDLGSSFMLINTNLTGANNRRSTVAHEFSHASQWSYVGFTRSNNWDGKER